MRKNRLSKEQIVQVLAGDESGVPVAVAGNPKFYIHDWTKSGAGRRKDPTAIERACCFALSTCPIGGRLRKELRSGRLQNKALQRHQPEAGTVTCPRRYNLQSSRAAPSTTRTLEEH